MKSVQCVRYGTPDVLRLVDAAKPTPKDNELLIRVHATAVTPSDVAFRSGDPFVFRLFTGLLRPKYFPGTELAGVVEAVGPAVNSFKPGDAVLGATGTDFGAYAEYKCLAEDGLVAHKPANMTFGDAVHLTDGGLTSLVFLRDHARLQPGQSILINGASGSVGAYAVQLAKYYGAVVTGVCSGPNARLVESIGADQVIDYARQDFTRNGKTYDVIFDAVGKSSFARCAGALKPGGIYMTTVPSLNIILQMARTLVGDKKAVFAATGLKQRRENLLFLTELYAVGTIPQ
ncbi:Alcohol dehydrogenase zinc-binding domain protein [Candidatus Promineifilum breve]|uniref:Alcohol dehydrogenase zinc-binding domain protein n=1 Tax=Candidatus Promineifilum breve TaxID=1806508 RepID=A0A160T4B7_9CHLR|nr:NAD(P)-dependent alcohol dehydrogenase [Candidatus Promineifilum breve]CUS04694.2 Alcohol dehydrogenase zinc-binding domain protein [Candidatus Promineifilum breve]